MPSEKNLPALLTSQEIASWLQIPEPEVRKAISQGWLPALLQGGLIPFDLAGKTRYYNQQDLEAIKYQLKHDEEESETA